MSHGAILVAWWAATAAWSIWTVRDVGGHRQLHRNLRLAVVTEGDLRCPRCGRLFRGTTD